MFIINILCGEGIVVLLFFSISNTDNALDWTISTDIGIFLSLQSSIQMKRSRSISHINLDLGLVTMSALNFEVEAARIRTNRNSLNFLSFQISGSLLVNAQVHLKTVKWKVKD